MFEFEPYLTADGSLGLYNSQIDDIYHSAGGALTESLEKFVLPIDFDVLLQHKDINILDICYGIGYNSKTFLNYLFENQKKFLKSKKNISSQHTYNYETIYTDNIFTPESINIEKIHTDKNNKKENISSGNISNGTIYSDKIFENIYINAVDNNYILPALSPFIRSDIRNSDNQLKNTNNRLNKYLKAKIKSKIKLQDEINYLMYDAIYNYSGAFTEHTEEICKIIDKYKHCFSSDIRGIFKSNKITRVYTSLFSGLIANLHNIYYRYISNRYKRAVNHLKIGNLMFDINIDDARNTVKSDNLSYNLIFLDAFSPTKCPCLWSYDFFVELFRLLSDDGMLLTYSTSAAVRSAMLEAGFKIGYIKKAGNIIGTVCTKNQSLIKYPLSEFDFGLLNTRAGIFYRDENLTGQNEVIIASHKSEVENSSRISTTQYIKKFEKENLCMMS